LVLLRQEPRFASASARASTASLASLSPTPVTSR
jgi:hypothetical protein